MVMLILGLLWCIVGQKSNVSIIEDFDFWHGIFEWEIQTLDEVKEKLNRKHQHELGYILSSKRK